MARSRDAGQRDAAPTSAKPWGFLRSRHGTRPRCAHRLEHHRLRSGGAGASGGARAPSAHPRARRGCDPTAQGRRLFRQRPGLHSRPPGARRHRPPARRVRAHGRLLARRRGARRCSAKARPSPATRAIGSRKSSTTTSTISRLSRSMRAPMRGLPTKSWSSSISYGSPFARSQLTGMTPDRVAASIASFDFLYLTELERRAIVAPTRAQRRFARACGAAGRPRARARQRPAPQRLGVRLQEPVSEHHPHVQHRSAVVCRQTGARRPT